MSIGARIKQRREELCMTQEQLAEQANTTKQTIFKYETGKVTNIPLDRIELLAKGLCVSSAWLMGWEQKNHSKDAINLTAGEEQLLELFRQIPEAEQPVVLDMISAALSALNNRSQS